MTRVAFVGFTPLVVLALGACGGASGAPSAGEQHVTAVQSSPDASLRLTPLQRRFAVEGLGELALTPEQRTGFLPAAEAAKSHYAETHLARRGLLDAIAEQLSRGAIDREVLRPQVEALNLAVEREDEANLAALASVLLTPAQRDTLTTKLAQRVVRAEESGERRARWVKTLALNETQRERLTPDRSPIQSWSDGERRLARNGGTRLVRLMTFLERIAPTLTDTQRQLAADNLEKGASR
jgi:hypothetical protein